MSSVINTRLGFGRYEQRLAPQLPIAHPLRVAPRRTKGTVAPLPPYIQPVATRGDSRWWGPLPNAKRRKSCHGACLVAAAIQLAQAVATNGSSRPPPVLLVVLGAHPSLHADFMDPLVGHPSLPRGFPSTTTKKTPTTAWTTTAWLNQRRKPSLYDIPLMRKLGRAVCNLHDLPPVVVTHNCSHGGDSAPEQEALRCTAERKPARQSCTASQDWRAQAFERAAQSM